MHELEQFETVDGNTLTAFAAVGARTDIWHQLGQMLDGTTMTAEEAMRAAHMNRSISIYPVQPPDGAQFAIPELYHVVLGGDMIVTEDGDFAVIPDKVVGVHGKGGADAHANFTMHDRFALAEQAIHASSGEAVWSTAGMLRNGTQGFACMEAPPTVIDPNGIRDVIRRYLTVTWSFDGSRSTELGGSDVRVLCANTMAMHDKGKDVLIRVKHTSASAEERFRLAAQQWSLSQDRQKALVLMAEDMLRIRGAKTVLNKIVEKFMPERPDSSKREKSLRQTRVDTLEVLAHSPTNTAAGDNAWAAYNTFVEYLDWEAPVKCSKGETELDRRLGNQFDGANDDLKSKVADFILAGVS